MRTDSPYVGPRTFTEKDRGKFYGRGRELDDLMHLLLAERIVLLYSPSGAGKSSLLQAGLIPQLKELGFETKGPLRVNDLANFPWEQLAKDPHGEVLIFDQFEETVTVDPLNLEPKKNFFQQLGQALRNRERWAVFAIREDYLASLDPYLNFIPTRLSNTFRLNLLGEKGAKDAICLPAKNAGVPFTKEASDALFDDLRTIQLQLPDGGKSAAKGDFVEPVQLQVVCDRIWRDLAENPQEIRLGDIQAKRDRANKDSATKDAVDAKDSLSEVDRALADFYSDTVKNVAAIPDGAGTNITERDLRDWFERRLITHQGIRTQVLRSEGLGNRISEELEKAHIVRSETRSNRDFLELAHDRLIQPLLASNKEWRDSNLSPFQQEAEKWNENNQRSPDRLLRGQALGQAESWAKSNALNATERDFLKASQRARWVLLGVRCVAAVMVILLATVVVYGRKFYQQKTLAQDSLTAGRNTAHHLAFDLDGDLEKIPNTGAARKDLLKAAINLNQELGENGGGAYNARLTDWWVEQAQGRLAEVDAENEEAKEHYEAAKKIAAKMVADYGNDPEAEHSLWLSYAAVGDLEKKEGDDYNTRKDKSKASRSWNNASEQYKQAAAIAVKLVDGNPNDPSNGLWRFGLYFLYKGLGDSVDNPKEAREYYNQALRESTRLAKEDAKDYPGLDPQSLRWQSLIDLADMNRNEGNEDQKNHKEQEAKALWKDARDLYQEALPVALKLAQSQPPGDIADADQWQDANQQTLWVSYMMLGTMEQDAHDKRRWYEKAMGLATSRYQNEQKAAARKPAQEQQGKKHPSESQAKKDLEKTLDALRRLDRAGKK